MASSAPGAVELAAVGSEHADITNREHRAGNRFGTRAIDEVGGLELAECAEPFVLHHRRCAIADFNRNFRAGVVDTSVVVDNYVDVAAIFGSDNELRVDGDFVSLVGLDASVQGLIEFAECLFLRSLRCQR